MRRLGATLAAAFVLSLSAPQQVAAATIERTYPVGNEPFGVTVDPSDGRIYVANSDQGDGRPGVLSVIDPSTNSVTAIPLVASPTMSALDRGLGRLFVTTANSELDIIEVASQTVVTTVPNVGSLGVAVDEATHHVYVAGITSISMIDGATGSVLHREPAGPDDSWWGVAVGGGRVYVTNLDLGAPSLVVLSAADLSFVREVPLPEVPRLALAYDAGRQVIYVGGYSSAGNLYVVDAASLMITRTVDPDSGSTWPLSAMFDPTRDRIYLSQFNLSGPSHIAVVDPTTLGVVERIALPWQPGQTALHPNGRLYVAGFSADVLAAIVANSAPVLSSVTLSPPAPRTNDTLTATAFASDADGDLLTYTFTWKVEGVVRTLTTGPNASSSFDLSLTDNGDRGQTVSVEVAASDGTLQSATMSTSTVVANTAPTVTVSLSDATPQTRDVLVATANAQDADADPLTLTYIWRVNGVVKQMGTSNTFDLAPKGNGENGDVVAVTATASDGSATASAGASATVTPHKH